MIGKEIIIDLAFEFCGKSLQNLVPKIIILSVLFGFTKTNGSHTNKREQTYEVMVVENLHDKFSSIQLHNCGHVNAYSM